jgi:H+/gluconate symporter-like permease
MAVGDGQMGAWSIFIFIVFFASVPLATEMARERGRSRKLWFWIAFCVGPLAPIVLLVLGDRRDSEANQA